MNYKNRPRTIGERISLMSGVWLIAIITIALSIIGTILFMFYPRLIDYVALNPSRVIAGAFLWTLVTHIFFHGGFFHLFVNMMALFSIGSLCERIIGKKRFIVFYILAGLFAGIVAVLFSGLFGYGFGENIFGSPNVVMVGASGALFAIAGLFVMLLPKLRFGILFIPFFSLPAYIMVPLVLFLVWGLSIFAGLPIGNSAHFGGFLAGIGYGLYLKTKYRKKVMVLQRYFGAAQ
jgi:membrane associated rhomboid family serine protease